MGSIKELCLVVLSIFTFVIVFVFAATFGIAHLNANTMEKLGYEAKVTNMDCFTKYNSRWVLCSAVAANQHELVTN